MKFLLVATSILVSLTVVSFAHAQGDCNCNQGGHTQSPFSLWEDQSSCCSGCGVHGCTPSLWPIFADGARDLVRSLAPKRNCVGTCNGVCCSAAPMLSYRKRQRCSSDLWDGYQQRGRVGSLWSGYREKGHHCADDLWSGYKQRKPFVHGLWSKKKAGNCAGNCCSDDTSDYFASESVGTYEHSSVDSSSDYGNAIEQTAPAPRSPATPYIPAPTPAVNSDESTDPFRDDDQPLVPVPPQSTSLQPWKPMHMTTFTDRDDHPAPRANLRQASSRRTPANPQPSSRISTKQAGEDPIAPPALVEPPSPNGSSVRNTTSRSIQSRLNSKTSTPPQMLNVPTGAKRLEGVVPAAAATKNDLPPIVPASHLRDVSSTSIKTKPAKSSIDLRWKTAYHVPARKKTNTLRRANGLR